MTDQPTFEVEYVERRSRLSTFFRYLLAIPHFFVLFAWGIIAEFAIFIAWFAIVITGRYPEGLYAFNAGYLRYSAQVNAYVSLLADDYPPFSGDDTGYAAQLVIPPRLESYSRAKTFFRFIFLIPVAIIAYAMRLVWVVGSFLSWIVIVLTGRQPQGLQDMTQLGLSYEVRITPYGGLLTEAFPAFTNPSDQAQLGSFGGGSGLPSGSGAGSFDSPEAPRGGSSSSSGLSGGDPLAG
jgi:hypothetical protein